MATKTFIGNVGSEGISTGPHLHQYVKDLRTGKMIDPRTLQSPLLDIRVGQQETPLVIKDASGNITFNPAAGATITSEFGSRTAPTPGASSFHQGRDIALPYGTPVKYFGSGQYIPGKGVSGYGNLGRIITPDQRYEIGFGHLSSVGQATNAPPPLQLPEADTGNLSGYEESKQRTNDLLEAFLYGTQYNVSPKEPKEKAQSFVDIMKEQLLRQALNPETNSQIPTGLPQEYTNAIWG